MSNCRFHTSRLARLAALLGVVVIIDIIGSDLSRSQHPAIGSGDRSAEAFKSQIDQSIAKINTSPDHQANRSRELDALRKRLMQEAMARGGTKPIYGTDDRADWYEIDDPPVKRRAAASVALFQESALPQSQPNGNYTVRARSLREAQQLCSGEHFAHQIAGSFCSGVLIAADVVATAGHCIREVAPNSPASPPRLADIRFVFGYYASTATDAGRSVFGGEQVFRGAKVLASDWHPGDEDWAVVKLDRPVPSELAQPIEQIRSSKIEDDAPVYVIGYPSGVPLKYAPNAVIKKNFSRAFFVANLDTFGGNSGSGVFRHETNELIGILVRGDRDYFRDDDGDCYRAFVCPTTGCSGEDVTRIELVQGRR